MYGSVKCCLSLGFFCGVLCLNVSQIGPAHWRSEARRGDAACPRCASGSKLEPWLPDSRLAILVTPPKAKVNRECSGQPVAPWGEAGKGPPGPLCSGRGPSEDVGREVRRDDGAGVPAGMGRGRLVWGGGEETPGPGGGTPFKGERVLTEFLGSLPALAPGAWNPAMCAEEEGGSDGRRELSGAGDRAGTGPNPWPRTDRTPCPRGTLVPGEGHSLPPWGRVSWAGGGGKLWESSRGETV